MPDYFGDSMKLLVSATKIFWHINLCKREHFHTFLHRLEITNKQEVYKLILSAKGSLFNLNCQMDPAPKQADNGNAPTT